MQLVIPVSCSAELARLIVENSNLLEAAAERPRLSIEPSWVDLYPDLAFTAHTPNDPPGEMQTEGVLQTGKGSQKHSSR